MRPLQLVTNPIEVMHTPHRILPTSVSVIVNSASREHIFRDVLEVGTDMVIGRNLEGRNNLIRMLARVSNTAYAMKKIINVKLYFLLSIGISVVRSAILAFPMLVRSRNASK